MGTCGIGALLTWILAPWRALFKTISVLATGLGGLVLDVEEGLFDSSILSKIVRSPFPSRSSHAKAVIDIVRTDICESLRVKSIGEARYVMIMVDDHFRYL